MKRPSIYAVSSAQHGLMAWLQEPDDGGWRGEGASTQVCFIDHAQDGRKPVNMRMNNAVGEGKGNRDLLKR